jgi:hypothetical protein
MFENPKSPEAQCADVGRDLELLVGVTFECVARRSHRPRGPRAIVPYFGTRITLKRLFRQIFYYVVL